MRFTVYFFRNPAWFVKSLLGDFPSWPDDYRRVAEVDAPSLPQAFVLTQNLSVGWHQSEAVATPERTRLGPQRSSSVGDVFERSSSVGDVFVDPDGAPHRVAALGFIPITDDDHDDCADECEECAARADAEADAINESEDRHERNSLSLEYHREMQTSTRSDWDRMDANEPGFDPGPDW